MSIRQIACCTDFSENSEAAFAAAVELAKKYEAKLIILHVLPPVINPVLMDTELILTSETNKSLLLKLEERMIQEYGDRIDREIDYEMVVLEGHISSEVINYLEENPIDLVVMGAYGFSGMGLVIFGSVAKRVSHKAPCSVMIIRKRDSRRPIT